MLSLPPWERGLKHRLMIGLYKDYSVAPPVGAWIETMSGMPVYLRKEKSLPPWERGLKRVNVEGEEDD